MAEVPSPRVGYRAILRSVGEQPLFLEVLGQQLGAWLAEKDVPTQIDDLSDWSDDQRAVTIRRWRGDDSVRYVRARMKEIQPGALTWITDVLASSEGWVSLTVENSAGRFVAVPRLARYMLELIPLGLGPDRFQDCAEIVDSKDVRDLVASILHDDRRTATFVIGTDERLGEVGESLVVKASKWAREMTGLGRFVVLSADATRRFQEIAGTHAVQPWTLRTFLTNARFDDPIDARRHRWLSTLTLAERDDKWIARMLGDVARAQAWQASEPSEVRRARSSFERLVQAQLVAAAQATPAPSAELQTAPTVGQGGEQLLEEMQQMLHQVFGVRVTEPEALTEVLRVHEERKRSITDLAQRLEDQQLTIDALQESQAQAQWLLEEDELEAAQAQLDLESRSAEIAWLRAQLAKAGDYASAHSAPPSLAQETPEDFEALLMLMETNRFPGVVFTGDRQTCIELSGHDTLQAAVRNAAEALRALTDYVRCRNEGHHSAGFKQYLESAPGGFAIVSPKKHAPTETAITMQRFGSYREFPVPASVAAGGSATMTSHFKLARIGMVSPRMYYLDDYVSTGTIYVGYIGPHLPNTQTN